MATTLNQNNVSILRHLVENNQEANTFLQREIFGDKGVFDKSYIELHRYENNDGILTFSENPDGTRHDINAIGYKKVVVNPVYTKGKLTIDHSDLLALQAGESSSVSLERNRANRILKRLGEEVTDKFLNTKEDIAAKLLTTGKYTDENNNESDYNIPNENRKTLTNDSDKWSDASADILGQLQDWQALTAESGLEADTVIMGGTAYSNFLRNEEIRALMDNRRIEVGSMEVRKMGVGVKSAGVLDSLNLNLFSYTAKIGGNFLIPTNMVILINTFKKNANFYHTHNGRDDFNGAALQLTPYRDEENGKQKLAVDSGMVAALQVPAGVVIATVG